MAAPSDNRLAGLFTSEDGSGPAVAAQPARPDPDIIWTPSQKKPSTDVSEDADEGLNPACEAAFERAADGTRTHDLLHGKQLLSPLFALPKRVRGVGG
jgi:hypothetical protein